MDENFQLALQLFDDVKKVYQLKKNFVFEKVAQAFKFSYDYHTSEQSQAFLSEYLLLVSTTFLNQSPKLTGQYEKEKIEETLRFALHISIHLLKGSSTPIELREKSILTLAKLFNENETFYKGIKVFQVVYQGCPIVRNTLVKEFIQLDGFQIILDTIKQPDFPWIGTQHLSEILMGLELTIDSIDNEFIFQFVQDLLGLVLSTHDEKLRKETPKSFSSLFRLTNRKFQLCLKNPSSWLEIISKLRNSGSIVLRLIACDLIVDILVEALKNRPIPATVSVEGAGSEEVNGTYEFVRLRKPNNSPLFQLKSKEISEGVYMTLFLCDMEKGTKNWFISIPNLGHEGTSKDIDYYSYSSTHPEQRGAPPVTGWNCEKKGMSPCPTIRIGPDQFESEHPTLSRQLCEWARECKLVEAIFTPSNFHREISSRSEKLLLFLAEFNALSLEDLRLIWTCAIQTSETESVDEIIKTLVQIIPRLSPELFTQFLDLLSGSVDNEAGFQKLMTLMEALSKTFQPPNIQTPGSPTHQLLQLLWRLFLSQSFQSYRGCLAVQGLLSACFACPEGSQFILSQVEKFSSFLHPSSPTDSQETINRFFRPLLFLLSDSVKPVEVVAQLYSGGFSELLVSEIQRFTLENRSNAQSKDEEGYLQGLGLRLELLSQFFGIVDSVKLSFEVILSLWELFQSSSLEIQKFLSFLAKGSQRFNFLPSDLGRIFYLVICHEKIDWSLCTDECFACFEIFFSKTFNFYDDASQFTASVDTLWRIILNIPSPASSVAAIELFLKAVSDYTSGTPQDIHSQISDRVFQTLAPLMGDASLHSPKGLATAKCCIEIISRAMTRFVGYSEPAHGVRGTTSLINIKIRHKRYTFYYTQAKGETCYPDRSTEGVLQLEVHPLMSILELKKLICKKLRFSIQSEKLKVELDFKPLQDNLTLDFYRVEEGSELMVGFYCPWDYKFNPAMGLLVPQSTSPSFSSHLSESQSYFNTLLSLCHTVSDFELKNQIWGLLQLLPTPVFVNSQLLDLENPVVWEEFLPNSQLVSLTFNLQSIDHLLQPSPDTPTRLGPEDREDFLTFFVSSGGFKRIVDILVQVPTGDAESLARLALGTSLHIIHFFLFGEQEKEEVAEKEGAPKLQRSLSLAGESLLDVLSQSSGIIVGKLLTIAGAAALSGQTDVVQDALATITLLLRSPDVASQLISDPNSQSLLSTVLRSSSVKVRILSSDFAIEIGKSQPVVFSWLISILAEMQPGDVLGDRTFIALSTLLPFTDPSVCSELASTLSHKILKYPRGLSDEKRDLSDLLGLLSLVVLKDHSSVLATELGENLVPLFLKEFLFAMPEDGSEPLCNTPETRMAAFDVLFNYLDVSHDEQQFSQVIGEITSVASSLPELKSNWEIAVGLDIRRPGNDFSGLKNQGCTCYMNALLQQFYMARSVREAILATPILDTHRNSLWHKTNEEIVGTEVLMEFADGSWKRATVLSYSPEYGHSLKYVDEPDSKPVIFQLHEGRTGQETGRVKPVPKGDILAPPASERELAAYGVLEQLQRTFLFLKHSKKRYFNPRPFVDACKSLNLNFNVYHQNDASEFCDQLLDRIETSTRGKHTARNVWDDLFLQTIFGGSWLYQKVPRECDRYSIDKKTCGHWLGGRKESFMKVELNVRGKENIYQSLDEMVAGELMDGENKIDCDVCKEKKATVRRSCFGSLPNTLIIHLKRFDLDFTTFETVKLNNCMAFDTKINLMKYTKEGLELEERKQLQAQAAAIEASGAGGEGGAHGEESVQYESPSVPDLNPEDYDFELQGVLVHSGVAQGGHYYSFAKDPDSDAWYKFDDDDVTPFNPEQIPQQCFGGPQPSTGYASTMDAEDRISNALMLVYKKVTPLVNSPQPEESSPTPTPTPTGTTSGDDATPPPPQEPQINPASLVDGNTAFMREVQESNKRHTLSCYLIDASLHSFVRRLLASVISRRDSTDPATAASILQFGLSFLFDTILHCRERVGSSSWAETIGDFFRSFPPLALDFLHSVLVGEKRSWLRAYLFFCSDSMSRSIFVQVLVSAVSVVLNQTPHIESDFESILRSSNNSLSFISHDNNTVPEPVLLKAQEKNPPALLFVLLSNAKKFLYEIPKVVKHGDEVISLVKDLAAFPLLGQALRDSHTISQLCYFVRPLLPPQSISARFAIKYFNGKPFPFDSSLLLLSAMEALASLIGIPQIRRVPLLTETTSYYDDPCLLPKAQEALTQIFNEFSTDGFMDAKAIDTYRERIGGPSSKPNANELRILFERFGRDHKLDLEGFLNFYRHESQFYQKNVWKELNAMGFRNDLTRSKDTTLSQPDVDVVAGVALRDLPEIRCSPECMGCLRDFVLYESSLSLAEDVCKGVLLRVCYGRTEDSVHLMNRIATCYFSQVSTWNYLYTGIIFEIICSLLALKDSLFEHRLRELMLGEPYGFIVNILRERETPSTTRANEYDRFTVYNKFVNSLWDLTKRFPTVPQEIRKMSLTHPTLARLIPTLKLTPSVNASEEEIHSVVHVSGAGLSEVNGTYKFASSSDSTPIFVKEGVWGDSPATFAIFKYQLRGSKMLSWFLSKVPHYNNLGTKQDIDLYMADSLTKSRFPINLNWELCGTALTKAPAPTVTVERDDLVNPLPQPQAPLSPPPSIDFNAEEDDDYDDDDNDSTTVNEDGSPGHHLPLYEDEAMDAQD